MPTLLSPGVVTTETDLTTVVPAVGSTAGGYAGVFKWGPAMQPTVVTNVPNLTSSFGYPDIDTYISFYTAYNFLQYGSNLTLIRAISTAALNASGNGEGVLVPNLNTYDTDFSEGSMNGLWIAKWPGEYGNNILVSIADAGNYGNWPYAKYFTGAPNTSAYAAQYGGSDDEVHVIVIDADGHITGTAGGILERYAYLSKGADAKAEDGTSNYYPNVINNESAWIWWGDFPSEGTNWGNTVANTAFDVLSTTMVFTSVSGGPFVNGETIAVYEGSVTGTSGLSGGSGYHTGTTTITFSAPEDPNGVTATATVTISSSPGPITAITITNEGSGYTNTPTYTITDTNGSPGSGASLTPVVTYNDVPYKSGIVDNYNSGTKTLTYNATLGQITTSDLVIGLTSDASGTPTSVTGEDVTQTMLGGVDGNDTITDGEIIEANAMFLDTESYPISLLLGGNADTTVALYLIQSIADVVLDLVVFLSPPMDAVVNNPGNEVTDSVNFRNTLVSDSYSFLDGNWKYQYDVYNDVYRWVPCNGDIAGLAVATDQSNAPWWSFAGLNRGILKNVIQLAYNPSQTDRDTLYSNSINPIVTLNGIGPVLYGDKTLLSKPSAFSHINVRRLFIVLEQAISAAAKYSLFEFNDSFTQSQFISLVTPYLRDVQGQRGIIAFDVVCDSTNNTPQVVMSNQFVGDIYIQPNYSINFITLNFVATPQGVAFSEIVGTTGIS